MKNVLGALLVTALVASTAHAERTPAPIELTNAAKWLRDFRKGSVNRLEAIVEPDASGVTRCQASINTARAAGATTLFDDVFEHFGGKKLDSWYHVTPDEAEKICTDAAFYNNVVLKDVAVFYSLQRVQDFDELVKIGYKPDAFDEQVKLLDRCESTVDAMLAANVEPSMPFKLSSESKTVADIKLKFCAKKRETLKKYFEYYKQEEVKDREPYLKAGLKGDKLEFVMQYDGYLYLPGGVSTDSLKKLAAAPALFVWTTTDPDAADYVVHTVRKHVFKGNKLVRTSEKTYRMKRGATLGGGVFK